MNEKLMPVLVCGKSPLERFMLKVQKMDNGCWQWCGKIDHNGYGEFSVRRLSVKAHRFAYHSIVGPIPDGLTLDHLCRNRGCVNPEHLEPVTMRVNLMRGNSLQSKNANKTHCIHGHPFNERNTRWAGGFRQCRECLLIAKEKKRRLLGLKPKGRYSTKITRQWPKQSAIPAKNNTWQEQRVLP